jgi:hypothetical protein
MNPKSIESLCIGLFNLNKLFKRFLQEYPRQQTYIKVAKYEQKLRNIPLARQIFEKAMDDLGSFNLNEEYYI